jgi:hypothetical protein
MLGNKKRKVLYFCQFPIQSAAIQTDGQKDTALTCLFAAAFENNVFAMIRAVTTTLLGTLAALAGANDVPTTSTTTSSTTSTSFLLMPLDVTTFKNQIEVYESGFHQTMMVNGQAGYRNLWGEIVISSTTTSTDESAEAADVVASRALHDANNQGHYVNANFNDLKNKDIESPYTEYKDLTFFLFEFFDISKAPRSQHIPSEMRGKAAGFTVLGSISVTDPDKAFTPVSFDISSPSIDNDGYLHSIIVGFQYDNIGLIMQAIDAIIGYGPITFPFNGQNNGLADHKNGPNGDSSDGGSVSIPIVNTFIPNFNIPPELEAFFPSMIQGFTLRGNKAKRIYLDGFEDVKQLYIINLFGRGVTSPQPIMVMDNLVYTDVREVQSPFNIDVPDPTAISSAQSDSAP